MVASLDLALLLFYLRSKGGVGDGRDGVVRWLRSHSLLMGLKAGIFANWKLQIQIHCCLLFPCQGRHVPRLRFWLVTSAPNLGPKLMELLYKRYHHKGCPLEVLWCGTKSQDTDCKIHPTPLSCNEVGAGGQKDGRRDGREVGRWDSGSNCEKVGQPSCPLFMNDKFGSCRFLFHRTLVGQI